MAPIYFFKGVNLIQNANRFALGAGACEKCRRALIEKIIYLNPATTTTDTGRDFYVQ